MGRASHISFASFKRRVARRLGQASRVKGLARKWHQDLLSMWMSGKPADWAADYIEKYEKAKKTAERLHHASRHFARDASNPRPGEVYETRWGNRWVVTGKTPKGRVLVKRTTPRYDGELQWTPAMLARLKQVRGQEAKAVEKALPADLMTAKFPSGASLFERIMGRKRTSGEMVQVPLPGLRDPNRRYHVYVIETLYKGKRQFYVGQTGKKPEQRFKEHKKGYHFSYAHGARVLRKDLTRKVPTLYTRKQAERAEKIIARVLRKRGLKVIGGH